MKTRERLLFMVLGGLLVLAGMILGQFVFSTAQAQAGAQDAMFKTVKCERLEVRNSFNSGAVIIGASAGFGSIFTSNASGKIVTSLGANEGGHGLIETRSKTGKNLVILSSGENDKAGKVFGGDLQVYNIQGERIATIQANKDKDGMIVLYDRYGNIGWGKIGKQ